MPDRSRTIVLPRRALTLMAIAAACATGDGDRGAYHERDSSGIRVVENGFALDSAPGQWTLGAEPITDIGTADGDSTHQLYRVAGATLLGDGRLIIANGGTNELRAFDGDGTFMRSIGRAGEGPGEFRGLSSVWVGPGDTLFAWDYQLRRLSVFTSDGTFIRTRQAPTRTSHFAAGVLDDGSVLYAEQPSPRGLEVGRVVDHELVLLRHDSARDAIDSLGRYPHSRTRLFETPGRSLGARPVVFSAFGYVAVAGERIAIATGREPQVRLVESRSGRVSLIRWASPARPVTAGDIERYKQTQLDGAPDASVRARMLAQLGDEVFADRYPTSSRILLDDRGRIWVEHWRESPADAPTMWTVFGADGKMLATVAMPRAFRLLAVRGDRAVGSARDELDVERVQVFPLTER